MFDSYDLTCTSVHLSVARTRAEANLITLQENSRITFQKIVIALLLICSAVVVSSRVQHGGQIFRIWQRGPNRRPQKEVHRRNFKTFTIQTDPGNLKKVFQA